MLLLNLQTPNLSWLTLELMQTFQIFAGLLTKKLRTVQKILLKVPR